MDICNRNRQAKEAEAEGKDKQNVCKGQLGRICVTDIAVPVGHQIKKVDSMSIYECLHSITISVVLGGIRVLPQEGR